MNNRSVGTHDGTFHADEVTACALLLVFDLVDEDKIIRTRDSEQLSGCEYVCDVGGIYEPARKLFDHHQVEYQGPLSSAGMVLHYLHEIDKIDAHVYLLLKNSFVDGVDAHDNGLDPQIVGLCTYSHIITNFNPIPHESSPEKYTEAFFDALHFAKGHLQRLLQRDHYIQSCRQVVARQMASRRQCLIFDHSIPWMESFFEMEGVDHPALFVIMPSGKHWKLRGIPPSLEHRMEVRLPLPQEWAGMLDDDLKQISGITGAIFCHKGRFISVWESKEDALKALELALKEEVYDDIRKDH